MGILDFFRRRQQSTREDAVAAEPGIPSPKSVTAEVSNGLLHIPSIGFIGQTSRSPDGNYTLGWSDSDPSALVGGYRKEGRGCFVLLRGHDLILRGTLERPNDGKVSNSGIFIFNDWLLGDGLKGVFCAFYPTGQPILLHRFEANLHTNGLSQGGELAVCQTCNSPTPDGDKLSLFDLRTTALLWQIRPPTGWATSYQFDLQRGLVRLKYKGLGVFDYSLSGEFLDNARWEAAQIEKGDGYNVLQIARQRLAGSSGQLNPESVSELMRILAIAWNRLDLYPGFRAMVERTRGEISERQGDLQATIRYYEAALALDPKVGVKRRLASLTGESPSKPRTSRKPKTREITRLTDAVVQVERTPLLQDRDAPLPADDLGSFVAFDVETANPDIASICQVGLVEFVKGERTWTWQALVDPEDYFDPWNVAVHGIDAGQVAGAPSIGALFPELSARLGGRIVVSHTPFDRSAVEKAAEKHGLPPLTCTWLDSAKVVRRAWPETSEAGLALAKVAGALGLTFVHHQAAEDARVAGEILVLAMRKTGLSLEGWLDQVRRPITEARVARVGNPEGPLSGQVVVFTGTLSRSRAEAAVLAAQAGCTVADSVTRATTLLVVGEQDIRRLGGHEMSAKQKKAEELTRQGHEIRIVSEPDFCRLLLEGREGLAQRD